MSTLSKQPNKKFATEKATSSMIDSLFYHRKVAFLCFMHNPKRFVL